MVRLRWHKRFAKKMETLGPIERTRAVKSLSQVRADVHHPSLNFEKLSTDYFTIRVNLNFRIALLHVEGDLYEVIDIDTHTAIYHRYG